MNFNTIPDKKNIKKEANVSPTKKAAIRKPKKLKGRITPKADNRFTETLPKIKGINIIEIELPKQLPYGIQFPCWKGGLKYAIGSYRFKFGHLPRTVFYQRSSRLWWMTDKVVQARDVKTEIVLIRWRPKGSDTEEKVSVPKPPKITKNRSKPTRSARVNVSNFI